MLATITIVVGNVGALGQTSLKRLLAWSSVAQAGYMLAGVVVATQLGVQATVFYLAVYLVDEPRRVRGDRRPRARDRRWATTSPPSPGLGAARPLLALADDARDARAWPASRPPPASSASST